VCYRSDTFTLMSVFIITVSDLHSGYIVLMFIVCNIFSWL